jgi:hypothetical protein
LPRAKLCSFSLVGLAGSDAGYLYLPYLYSRYNQGVTNEATFGTIAALTRHFHREAHSPLGVTLRRLARSDRDRVRFFDAVALIHNPLIERKHVDGEVERVVIEAAQSDPTLIAAIGYGSISGRRPEEFAWLIDAEGGIIDPAWSIHRTVTVEGFYGVALGNVETANWLPGDHQRHAVSERDSARQRVAA